MNIPQQKAKGQLKIKLYSYIEYQYKQRKRKEKFRNLKRKLRKVKNCFPCKILRKISGKCEFCSILKASETKNFLDLWLNDDFNYIIYCNCEHYKIINFWLKLKRRFK